MREKKIRRQTELQTQRTILDSHVKAVYCHTGQTISQIFFRIYPMELRTSTGVTQKTVALRQLKTFRTLASSSLMYGHKRGCGLLRDQRAWPKWKPYDSTRIVLSLGPD